MSVETVSDVFAFILEQGDLTDTVLFSEQEIPELKPEERGAIEAVSQHVKESYVGLLFACREALLATAAGWPNRPMLEKNKSRPTRSGTTLVSTCHFSSGSPGRLA